ncbi:hypothetical protein LCGC14_1469460, partial [marine sediment metagenome]
MPNYALPQSNYKWKSSLPALQAATSMKMQGERLTLAKVSEERALRKEQREIKGQGLDILTTGLELGMKAKTEKEANSVFEAYMAKANPNYKPGSIKIDFKGKNKGISAPNGKRYSGPDELMNDYLRR